MKFTIGDGTQTAEGIRGIFQALTKAPLLRQEAEQMTGLRNAQTYNASMAGNKSGAEAESERYTLRQRKAVPDVIAADPSMSAYMKTAHQLFGLTGDTNMERFAKAAGEAQTQGIRDQAVANVDNLDRMNRYNTLAKPGETYEPFDNIGNTGTVFNKATGAGSVASSTLDKLFGDESRSKTAENYAQAERNRASTELIKTKTAGGGKGLTAAQLRANAEVEAAREALAGMTEDEIAALEKKDSFSLTAGDKNTLRLIQTARRAKFGEDKIPEVKPQPAPPPAPKSPTVLDTVMNVFKSPEASAAPVKVMTKAEYDKLPKGARYIDPNGTPRIKN